MAILLANAKGGAAHRGKVTMECSDQADTADCLLRVHGRPVTDHLKGLDARTGGRAETIELVENTIARGVNPNLA